MTSNLSKKLSIGTHSTHPHRQATASYYRNVFWVVDSSTPVDSTDTDTEQAAEYAALMSDVLNEVARENPDLPATNPVAAIDRARRKAADHWRRQHPGLETPPTSLGMAALTPYHLVTYVVGDCTIEAGAPGALEQVPGGDPTLRLSHDFHSVTDGTVSHLPVPDAGATILMYNAPIGAFARGSGPRALHDALALGGIREAVKQLRSTQQGEQEPAAGDSVAVLVASFGRG